MIRNTRLPRLLRWRALRWVLAAPAAVLAVWACTPHPLQKPNPEPEQETNQYFEINPIRDIDIIFAIDNSPSMIEEQQNIRKNFPAFINELRKIPGGLPDVHIGVISSDVGAGRSGILGGCGTPGGDRGVFRAKAGCGIDPGQRFVVSLQNETRKNYMGDLVTVFGCIADLGVAGCGYEHHLQSLRLSLYDMITPDNRMFLRKDAYLGIIILADEDDCSAPPESDLFEAETPGVAPSLRCNIQGHQCGGKQPQPMAEWKAPLSSCGPAKGGKLIDVDELVAHVKAVKPRPEQQIIVAGIVGLPNNDNAEYRIWKDPQTMDITIFPACQSPQGQAAPVPRIKHFIDQFGQNGSYYSICEQDFTPALKEIGARLASKIMSPCVGAPLVDVDKARPGLQADCQVIDRVPDPMTGKFVDKPFKACDRTGNAPPCWSIVSDMQCTASGRMVQVNRGGMAAPGTQQHIRCLTCANPSDPKCQ